MAQVTAYSVYRVAMVVVGVLVAAAVVIGVILLLQNRGEQVRHDQATQLAEQELKAQQKASVATSTSTKTVTPPSTPATTVATTTPAGALPKTGMSNSPAPFIAFGLLSFAVASYIASRQRLKAL